MSQLDDVLGLGPRVPEADAVRGVVLGTAEAAEHALPRVVGLVTLVAVAAAPHAARLTQKPSRRPWDLSRPILVPGERVVVALPKRQACGVELDRGRDVGLDRSGVLCFVGEMFNASRG